MPPFQVGQFDLACAGVARGDLKELEALLHYSFRDPSLLEMALTHRSYANEQPGRSPGDNEKLEFLGDAVLGLVVGHLLMDEYPELDEGQLSVTRAQVVSEGGLSDMAVEIGLGRWLQLGKGEEQTGGRHKPSILADAIEAVIAAVHLDGGFEAARALVERLVASRVEAFDFTSSVDFKTRLQERAQAYLKATPEYRVLGESGPDHDKTFEVCVLIQGREWARASGKSKKAAEQRAAAMASGLLEREVGGA
jgi:ribonuclease-3